MFERIAINTIKITLILLEDESYEEIVCTLTKGYVIEQMVTSGGILVPSFHQQFVFTIEEYPQELLRKSKDRFLEMVDFLDEQLR